MGNTELHNERELFVQIAQGSTAAFKIIFDKYVIELSPFVIKLTGSRETAQEVIQDVFLDIWQKRQRLGDIENPRAWIIRLASNNAINYLRKKASDGRLFEQLKQQSETVTTPEKILALKEITTLVQQAIQSLPAAQQAVYRLSREKHLTIPQIAKVQGVSPNTVKNQLVAALRTIRQYLENTLPAWLAWLVFYNFFFVHSPV